MKQGFLLGVGLSFLVPSVAWAHVALVDPPPRSGDNGLTAEPCGDVAPTGNPKQYMAGETITVTWAIGTSHGGTLRIELAEMNDMGFDEHVLAMDISDAEGMPESADVTLPDIDCDACTLRVIQVNPEEDNYVSCADVQLMGASAGSSGGATTGGFAPAFSISSLCFSSVGQTSSSAAYIEHTILQHRSAVAKRSKLGAHVPFSVQGVSVP